jgi:hypothetical protein
LENSLQLGRQINGPTHPITIATLESIAVVSLKMGNEHQSRSAATQWASALEDRRESVFYLSEGERLLWVKLNFNFSTPIHCLKNHQVADIILRWKGIVLDSVLEDRAIYKRLSDMESGPKLVDEIQDKKNQIAVILAEENFDRKKFEELQRSVELMESSIANQAMADGRARSFSLVTHEQIVARIPKESIVVDFVLYFDRIKAKDFYAASIIAADGTANLAILEDAEKALTKRSLSDQPSLVSTLLNMTDGILGDVLKLNVKSNYLNYILDPKNKDKIERFEKHANVDIIHRAEVEKRKVEK